MRALILVLAIATLTVAGCEDDKKQPDANTKANAKLLNDQVRRAAVIAKPIIPYKGTVFEKPGTFVGFVKGAGLIVHTVFTRDQAKGLGKCPTGKLTGGMIAGKDKKDLSLHLKCSLSDGWFTIAWRDNKKEGRWVVSHSLRTPNNPEMRFKKNCACGNLANGTKVCGLFAYSAKNGISEKEVKKKFGDVYVIEGRCPTP